MNTPIKHDTLRTAVGAAGVFTVLVVFTQYTLRSLAPVLLLSAGMLAYTAADDCYDLPEGSNWIAYGSGLVAVGVFLISNYATRFGGAVLLAGLWFAFDGTVTVRHGPARTPHRFVSGPESEAMLRMRIMNTVHRRLREASQPQTPADLAAACDLTESRVASALEYLQHRGQVESTGREYRVVPRNWGRATPLVRVVSWLPRRLFRPFRRLFANR
jgi:hypothetical protein